jgi:histone-lysine N-methyltransferase SETD2
MPLLHIVSFACTGATFTSAIAFLSAKAIEDYECTVNTYKGFMGNYLPLAIVTDRELALMRATEIAFPVAHKMLCRWHICKNVMAKHRIGFTEEDWQTFMTLFSGVMQVGTEDELQEKLVQIQTEWVGTQPRVVQYVFSWMLYKTYFIGAYVDKVPHFESSSSSRVEGTHLALKQRLQVSTGDMMTVVERVLQFLVDQYQEIDTTISQQKEWCNPIHSDMFYDQVCRASYFHLIKSYVVD